MKRYYYLLDGARFLAAFWVMNFHYLFGDGPHTEIHWYRYGNLGVQIFFIISGFVIVQSLKGKSLGTFALGRFTRLFPLFWLLCTITYVLIVFLPDARYVLHFSNYLRSMTMLNDAFDGFIGPATLIDPSYWTLTVELLFYTGVALFTYLFSYQHLRYGMLSWFLLSIAAFTLHVDGNVYIKLLLVRHAAYFIFGCALALIAAGEARTRFEWFFDRALLVSAAGYATRMHGFAIPPYAAPNASDAFIVACIHVCFFVAIPALVLLSRYVTHSRSIAVLSILGGLTYPLYLLHQRIGNILLDQTTAVTSISWFTRVMCFEVLMLAAAYVLFLLDKKMRTRLTIQRSPSVPVTIPVVTTAVGA